MNKKHYTIINIHKNNNNGFSLIIRTETDKKQLGFNTNTLINNLSIIKTEEFINNELYDLFKSLRIIDIKSGVLAASTNLDNNYYIFSSDIITEKFQKMVLLKYIVDRTLISKGINMIKTNIKKLKKVVYKS